MTIRYECPECHSVLKIRDEKAGQPGKCPRCRTEFIIPEIAPKLTADDLIDMPLEVTPLPVIPEQSSSPSDEFDPLAVLNSDSASGTTGPGENRPTIADLMKEHQQKKAKKEARKVREQPKKINPLLSDVETTGTAADAISRAYERKRDAGSESAPLTRNERRAQENRAALLRFLLRTGGAAVLFGVFAWGMLTWALSSPGVSLVAVTGTVTYQDQPLTGYRIRFTPVQEIDGPQLAGGPSSAKIRNTGEFLLMYDAQTPGAIVGMHKVTLEDEFGIESAVPDEFARQEVQADVKNHFEFRF